jgi:autotransporter-associated beta strand protein
VNGTGGGGFDIALGATMKISANLFDALPTESGDLIKYGSGELILANAANSYTGRTIVAGGTVTVGDNVTDGKLGLGEVQLEAADTNLLIHAMGQVDLTAKVTGLGSLTVNGTGKVRLLADNDYNGTNVLSGTLQIGNGGMVGALGLGPVLNDGLVLISRNGVVNISSEMTGSGTLRLSGSSGAVGADRLLVNLSRSLDLTGEVEVTNGTLHLSGTANVPLASRIKVQSGGTLDVSAVAGGYRINEGQKLGGNNGVVKGTILMAGTLAPGNSPGTLTLGGIQFASGSTYQVEIEQATGLFDSIAINGSLAGTGRAVLNGNGTVEVSPIGGLPHAGRYRILTAPEVDGEFAGISGGTALFTERLVYGGTSGAEHVDLELRYAKFEPYGIGKNGKSIGNYLDRVNGDGTAEMKSFVDDLGLTATTDGLGVKITEIGVSAYADTMATSLKRMLDLGASVGGRLEMVGMEVGAGPGGGGVGNGPSGWSGWTSTAASSMNREARVKEGFGGYHLDSQSSVLGVEMPLGPIRLGWVGATGTSRADFAMPNARVKSDSWHMGFYGVARLGRGYLDGLLMCGLVDHEADRTIGVAGFERTAKASFESEEFLLRLGGGFQVMPRDSVWEVSVNEHVSVAGVLQDSISETNAGALGVKTSASDSVGILNEVGLSVGRRFVVVKKPVLVRLRMNWVHDFREGGTLQARFMGAPLGDGTFGVESARGEKDAVRMSGSVDIGLSQRVSLRLGAEYELRRGAPKGTLSISVGVEF